MTDELFDFVVLAIKQDQYKLSRDGMTTGGTWPVKTWKRGRVQVQVVGDDQTVVILTTGLQVTKEYPNPATYQQGTVVMLSKIADSLR